MEIGEFVRQGDLGIMKIAEIPKGLKLEQRRNNILLEGEATGHHHKATAGQLLVYKEKAPKNEIGFLQLEEPAEIVHEEHNLIKLGVGVYRIFRQREFSYGQQQVKFVQD